jgi:hypothetical protein
MKHALKRQSVFEKKVVQETYKFMDREEISLWQWIVDVEYLQLNVQQLSFKL